MLHEFLEGSDWGYGPGDLDELVRAERQNEKTDRRLNELTKTLIRLMEKAGEQADYWHVYHRNRPAMRDELQQAGYPQK